MLALFRGQTTTCCLTAQVVAADGTPAEVRQAAAVNFKNHVKRHWNGTGRDVRSLDDCAATVAPIPDSEKV